MKKTFIFFLLSLIFIASLPAGAANKKIEANPINIAVSLTQKENPAAMASTCEYYGYELQPTHDGYTVFTHPNGSTIRYKYSDTDHRNSIIEVTTNATAKEKDNILTDMKFEKNGNAYERKHIGFLVRCTNGPGGTLILNTQRIRRL